MNTEQKLTKIRAKCVARIEYAKSNAIDFYGGDAIAAWESTIAAIDDCICVDEKQPKIISDIAREMMIECNAVMVEKIISAWEGLV